MNLYANPFLRMYFRDTGGIVVKEPIENNRLVVKSLLPLQIASRATDGTCFDELVQKLHDEGGLPKEKSARLVERLRSNKVFLNQEELNSLLSLRDDWKRHGWESVWPYHHHISGYPFVTWDDRGDWKTDLETEQIPPVYKDYDDSRTIQLSDVDSEEADIDIDVALSRLATQQTETVSALDEAQLSKLLYYSFGEVGQYDVEGGGKVLLKTSPSGGARHPTEAYLMVNEVEGVESGIYHYSVEQHGLDVIEQIDDLSEPLETSGIEADGADIVIVLTSKVIRSMIKYSNSRAFRFVQQDIGHLIETVKLLTVGAEMQFDVGTDQNCEALADCLRIDQFEEPIFGYLVISRP